MIELNADGEVITVEGDKAKDSDDVNHMGSDLVSEQDEDSVLPSLRKKRIFM